MFKLNLIVLKVETQLTNYFFIPESTFLRSPTSLLFLRMQRPTHAQTLQAPPCANHHPFFLRISAHTTQAPRDLLRKNFPCKFAQTNTSSKHVPLPLTAKKRDSSTFCNTNIYNA